MTLFEVMPVLGSLQSLMAVAYLAARRSTSLARALAGVILFGAFAFSQFESSASVLQLGLPPDFVILGWLSWAFIPPLAAVFGRCVCGLPIHGIRPLVVLLPIPALVLGGLSHYLPASCLMDRPCVGVAQLDAMWGMAAAAICGIALIRPLLANKKGVCERPLGNSRFILASLMASILLLRVVIEGAMLTGTDVAGGTAAGASALAVLALTVATVLIIRLYPEVEDNARVQSESDIINRYRRHLAQAVVFEEGGIGPLLRGTVLTTILTVLALIAWSSVTPVTESASTLGSVIPSSNIRLIQHLEGGIVSEVLVREGQLVEAGTVLMRLDPAQANSELEQLKARESGLELKAERLRAFAAGRAPEFEIQKNSSTLAQDQGNIFDAQSKARETAGQVIDRQIDQRKADIELFERQIASIRPQITLLGKEVAIREELQKKGLTSQVTYLNTMREYERLKGELARLQGQLKTAQEALGEATTRRVDMDSKLTQDALNEMGSVTSELAQLREARLKLEDRVNRLEILAPVRGLIQELAVTSPGTVIQQGGLVTKIVPVDDVLMVENQIMPRDIGHVRPGQPVRVKITSYDFARFGAVEGTLVQVSPSTFLDEKKNPYYKGLVALAKAQVGDDPGRNQILPGMTAQVDVITGEKTILQYLLKPLYVAAAQAFRER